MTPTIQIIAERAIRRLSGGDIPNDSPYDIDFIKADVRDAMREDLKLELLQSRDQRDNNRGAVTLYLATYAPIKVLFDAMTNRAYITLPESGYMNLKYNKGIHAVSNVKTPLKRMIPIANPGVTSNLPHADLERSNFGYYAQGSKIFWMRNIIAENIANVMVVLVIPAPESIGDNEALPLLPENVARILDLVVKRNMPMVPQDRIDDNDPNLRKLNA